MPYWDHKRGLQKLQSPFAFPGGLMLIEEKAGSVQGVIS